MNRRGLLSTLAGFPAMRVVAQRAAAAAQSDLHDPYADVDWEHCDFLHSMSHQHQGQNETSRDAFYEMGYRHFAFSNYYPSAPTYPLPVEYLAKHPDILGAPNAEQHSFPDAGLHFNSLGSLLATGYGCNVSAKQCQDSPLAYRFDGLNAWEPERPWRGVYRLDVRLASTGTEAKALLTVNGATECAFRDNFADKGPIHEKALPAGSHTIYLRAAASAVETMLTFDKARLSVTQYRLMQGANRPWRDVFRAALDGETVDGRHSGGLVYPEGGGITLNHPTQAREAYETMLDFDPRVLGIEVWNQLTSGFGSNKGFYDDSPGPHLHFYQLWDALLSTGRRCWGFFVKDHNTYGRGRNVLLVPMAPEQPRTKREETALRAYRTGAFFGSVAAMAVNEAGEVVAPYDKSEFRFSRITVRRDAAGGALAIEVAVAGNDPKKRPNVQIRFVTDQGIAAVFDAAEAEFPLPRDEGGRLKPIFVRIEAFAYPKTHLLGKALTADSLRKMNVHEISLLHDRMAPKGAAFSSSGGAELRSRIPIVDMIFSQPLRRV